MKVLVLAAGEGRRLRPLTADRPKALVELNGLSLLARQRRVFAELGLREIAVVTGYCAEAFSSTAMTRYHNPRWRETNMVYSLFQARDYFDGADDLLIAYGDIVFESRVLSALLAQRSPIAITSDLNWQRYWSRRFENVLEDVETLRLDPTGNVCELGRRPNSVDEIEGQYMGLISVKASMIDAFVRCYDELAAGGNVEKLYMTDFLQALIDRGHPVAAVGCHGGWLELDTMDDYRLVGAMAASGELEKFYRDY